MTSKPAFPISPFAAELRHLDAHGFDCIPDAAHRRTIREVVEGGHLRDIMKLLDAHRLPDGDLLEAYVPNPRLDHIEPFCAQIAREFEGFNVRCPPALIHHIVSMRALTIPLDDDALALALSRSWVTVVLADDLCESSPEDSLQMLRAATVGDLSSPLSRCCAFMFDELERFASPTFMPVFRMALYKSFIGTLIESHLANTAQTCGRATSDYIRRYNGYTEYFFLSMQFLGPALEYARNIAFWADIMPSCEDFLDDLNDLLSFYKEAADNSDFATGRLRIRARTEGRAYLDVYRDMLRNSTAAYHVIIQAAARHDPQARAQLAHYMRGMIYWHFHCSRYRLRDLFPDLRYFG